VNFTTPDRSAQVRKSVNESADRGDTPSLPALNVPASNSNTHDRCFTAPVALAVTDRITGDDPTTVVANPNWNSKSSPTTDAVDVETVHMYEVAPSVSCVPVTAVNDPPFTEYFNVTEVPAGNGSVTTVTVRRVLSIPRYPKS